jgi:hypothetical protein
MLKCHLCWRGCLVCTICYNVPGICQGQSKVLKTSNLSPYSTEFFMNISYCHSFSPRKFAGTCPIVLSCPQYDVTELSTRAYLFRVPFISLEIKFRTRETPKIMLIVATIDVDTKTFFISRIRPTYRSQHRVAGKRCWHVTSGTEIRVVHRVLEVLFVLLPDVRL